MSRKNMAQLNIRSAFARTRVAQLAAETGKTVTQIVEDAVRAYRPEPPREQDDAPAGMIRKGHLLIWVGDGTPITLEDTNRAIDAGRNRDLWGDEGD